MLSDLKHWAFARKSLKNGPVAQRLEQATHNRLVGGSNPSGPTNLLFLLRGLPQ